MKVSKVTVVGHSPKGSYSLGTVLDKETRAHLKVTKDDYLIVSLLKDDDGEPYVVLQKVQTLVKLSKQPSRSARSRSPNPRRVVSQS